MTHRSNAPTPTKLLLVLAALLMLAGLSFGLSYLRLGAWALPVALGTALVKAALVLGIFMEMSRESSSIRLAGVAAATMLLLLAGLAALDVVTRDAPPLLPPTLAEVPP